jgi:molybdopterin-guanine dinucleotide biosynthesis protein A
MNSPVGGKPSATELTVCTGVIMAGGGATRFGGAPKGLATVGDRRIIDRVADGLRECTDNLLLIANTPEAANWLPGVDVRGDIYPGSAGLGGVHAALRHSGTAVLVVAWDMPFVPTSLLRALREQGEHCDAALPASGSRRGLEPLCAFYSQACLPAIEQALGSGDKRAIAFHDGVNLSVLSEAEVSRHGAAEVIFMNVNTPEDLELAQVIAAGESRLGLATGRASK